jgi:hypothetical protein
VISGLPFKKELADDITTDWLPAFFIYSFDPLSTIPTTGSLLVLLVDNYQPLVEYQLVFLLPYLPSMVSRNPILVSFFRFFSVTLLSAILF